MPGGKGSEELVGGIRSGTSGRCRGGRCGERGNRRLLRIWTRSARRATLEAIVLGTDRRAWRCDVHHLVVGAGPVRDLFPRLENCEVGRAERTGWRENLMKRGRVVVLTES